MVFRMNSNLFLVKAITLGEIAASACSGSHHVISCDIA
jgi:hypothetical protein